MDNEQEHQELFALCQEAYSLLQWDSDDLLHHLDGNVYHRRLFMSDVAVDASTYHPLYTTDYILSKLPPVILDPDDKIFKHIQMWINGDKTANAGYVEPYAHDDKVAYAQKSDEMRKALLRLVLALHKSGDLK